jgi:hypothetical protein
MFCRHLTCVLVGISVLLGLAASRVRAQEIPLERCDALPLVKLEVDGQTLHFLVDTAATSLLNVKSFPGGRDRDVRITSWTGTVSTSAREVSVNEIVLGRTKLILLQLPAVDLSAVGKACSRTIDGILGADLLAKMGATIDLKRRLIHLATVEEERGAKLAKEMDQEMSHCAAAFNSSDEGSFADCLEPEITLFTEDSALSGREVVAHYFSRHYFHQLPAATLEISQTSFRLGGEAVWYEFEFTIRSVHDPLRVLGLALCRQSNGRLRVASMHQTVEHFEARKK